MTDPRTTQRLLILAADELRTSWGKFAHGDLAGGPVCGEGAIARAAMRLGLSAADAAPAYALLEDVIAAGGYRPEDESHPLIEDTVPRPLIPSFNDSARTTKADMLAAFEVAANWAVHPSAPTHPGRAPWDTPDDARLFDPGPGDGLGELAAAAPGPERTARPALRAHRSPHRSRRRRRSQR